MIRKTALVLFSLLLIGAYIAVEQILPYSGIKPMRTTENIHPDQAGFQYDTLEIQTLDHLKLKGYVLRADKPVGTIILLHGISDCKEHFYGFCRFLVDLHFNAVLIDLRAHGKSEGEFCTFGYFEKEDVHRLTDVESCRHITCPIFMAHGDADDKIPFAFGQHNFSALASADKEFEQVHGAGHENLRAFGGPDYMNKMKAFLLRQLK